MATINEEKDDDEKKKPFSWWIYYIHLILQHDNFTLYHKVSNSGMANITNEQKKQPHTQRNYPINQHLKLSRNHKLISVKSLLKTENVSQVFLKSFDSNVTMYFGSINKHRKCNKSIVDCQNLLDLAFACFFLSLSICVCHICSWANQRTVNIQIRSNDIQLMCC